MALLGGHASALARRFGRRGDRPSAASASARPRHGCSTPNPETTVACTFAQSSLRADRTAPNGLLSPIDGVIVNWTLELRYSDSVADTRAKLRVIQGNFGDGSGAEQVLPLTTGTYSFPARQSIFNGGRIGVDIRMTSGVIGGSVDVLSPESSVGVADKWVPPIGDGLTIAPTESLPDRELLLTAAVEPDRDVDGYGDETQDRVPDRRDAADHLRTTFDTQRRKEAAPRSHGGRASQLQ